MAKAHLMEIDPSESDPDWSKAGFAHEHAEAWRTRGFTLESAEQWLSTVWVFDPQLAAEWRDAGFGPKDADHLAEGGLTPAEAARYRRKPR